MFFHKFVKNIKGEGGSKALNKSRNEVTKRLTLLPPAKNHSCTTEPANLNAENQTWWGVGAEKGSAKSTNRLG